MREVFQVIPGRDPELPDKVPRRAFQVPIIPIVPRAIILRTPEVGVARDRSRAFEALKACLRFRRCARVKGCATEEFIGRDALLGAKFLACVLLAVI